MAEVKNAVWGFLETPTNWMTRQIGSLGHSGDGGNHYIRQKLRTASNRRGIRRLGQSGDLGGREIRGIPEIREIWEIWEIPEIREMGRSLPVQKWETLLGRKNGGQTNWEIEV